MLATLLSIALLHWIALVVPGPNVLVVSQLAAAGDRRAACFAALGITTVALIWSVLSLAGVSAAFTAHPQLRLALQLAGGAYLCWVALRMWRSGAAAAQPPSAIRMTAPAAYRLGFLTNITNPKAALFFGSVFATALPPQPGFALLLAAVAVAVTNAFVWHMGLALAFSRPGVQAAYGRQQRRLARVAGVLIAGFGARLLALTAMELRGR